MFGPRYEGEAGAGPFDRTQQRLAALPGVQVAALARAVPLWPQQAVGILVQGAPLPAPGRAPIASLNAVTADYFRALGLPVRAGRAFTAADGPRAERVAIINETMARTLWPSSSPLGRRIAEASADPARPDRWRTIVGVVADARYAGTLSAPDTTWQLYYPLLQAPNWGILAVLRTAGPPAALARDLRRAVAEVDATVAVYETHPARALVERSLVNGSVLAWTLFGFAALGVVLCALGVYGLFAGYVVQRTREMGCAWRWGRRPGRCCGSC